MATPSGKTGPPNPTVGVLVFYSVLVTVALLLVLVRSPESPELTPARVERDVERLAALVRHTRVTAPADDAPVHVTWTPAPGGYRGLVLLPQWRREAADAGAEVHLAVRLTLESPSLLRNPARPPLPSATLHREPAASDLVPPGHPRRLTLVLDPAAEGLAAARVSVDNVEGAAGRAADAAVGRAWAGVAGPAGPAGHEVPPEPWDLRVLDVLARTLRARICHDPADWSSCRATALTLTRSHEPRVFRGTLTALAGAPGAVPFEVSVKAAGDGLLEGTLRGLPGADLSLPADLLVLPPRGSLDVVSADDPGLVVAGWRPGGRDWETRRWRIDFRVLLEGTDW